MHLNEKRKKKQKYLEFQPFKIQMRRVLELGGANAKERN